MEERGGGGGNERKSVTIQESKKRKKKGGGSVQLEFSPLHRATYSAHKLEVCVIYNFPARFALPFAMRIRARMCHQNEGRKYAKQTIRGAPPGV